MSVPGYPPSEQRYQMQERARRMQFARPDWLGTIDDAAFAHRFLGVAVALSGDTRPTDRMVTEQVHSTGQHVPGIAAPEDCPVCSPAFTEQFEDGRRRLVVGKHVEKDTVKKLEEALTQIEYEEGRIRWVSDLIAGVATPGANR